MKTYMPFPRHKARLPTWHHAHHLHVLRGQIALYLWVWKRQSLCSYDAAEQLLQMPNVRETWDRVGYPTPRLHVMDGWMQEMDAGSDGSRRRVWSQRATEACMAGMGKFPPLTPGKLILPDACGDISFFFGDCLLSPISPCCSSFPPTPLPHCLIFWSRIREGGQKQPN